MNEREKAINKLEGYISDLEEYIAVWDTWEKTVAPPDVMGSRMIGAYNEEGFRKCREYLIENNEYRPKSGDDIIATCLGNFSINRIKSMPFGGVQEFLQYHGHARAFLGRILGDYKRRLTELKEMSNDEFVRRTSEDAKPLEKVLTVLERFPIIARQLRDRREERPTLEIEDEYDVQDLLHALLKIFFDDIRPEEWTPSYAGASARMDFLLKNEELVVEVKKTRKGLEAKQVGEQLIVDIEKYKEHPNCKVMVCFVYDPENRIGNPVGLENDLSRADEEFTVIVIVSPK